MSKLVRDNIPDIMKANGDSGQFHVADEAEYKEKLYQKLGEEYQEFLESESLEELADIVEVLHAIYALHNTSSEEVERIRQEKLAVRGGFAKRIVLESGD